MVHDTDFHRIDEGRLRSNQIALGVFIFQDYPKKSSDQVVRGQSDVAAFYYLTIDSF